MSTCAQKPWLLFSGWLEARGQGYAPVDGAISEYSTHLTTTDTLGQSVANQHIPVSSQSVMQQVECKRLVCHS
jgi:hypothetical protein